MSAPRVDDVQLRRTSSASAASHTVAFVPLPSAAADDDDEVLDVPDADDEVRSASWGLRALRQGMRVLACSRLRKPFCLRSAKYMCALCKRPLRSARPGSVELKESEKLF